MDTIQLQCGHCKKVMGVSKEHLGQQVQCPHCGLVVQTPAPTPTSPTDTVVQPPSSRQPDPPPRPFAGGEPTVSMTPPTEQAPGHEDATVPSAFTDAAPDAAAAAEFAQFKPKARADRGVFLIIALIFLVPYALTMTFFVFFLWMFGSGGSDPLRYLRDPVPSPDKGGARKVQIVVPDPLAKLAPERRGPLKKEIKAGDLLVTPQRVLLTPAGDLKLILRAKNVSANASFEPMHDSFVNFRKSNLRYTHLVRSQAGVDPMYGFNLLYFKNADASGEPESFPNLAPNEEITIVLETDQSFRQVHVPAIMKATNEELTWRVQVRRGFVRVDNKDVSATTVIGVDFTSKEIVREKS